MSQVCVGPAFNRDLDGTLAARLAGTPPNAALPASGNGIRLDPAKGLWAPSEHHTVQVGNTRHDAPGNKLVSTGNNWSGGICDEPVVNPSATRSLLVFFTTVHTVIFNIAKAADDNAGYTGWELLAGMDVDAASAGAALPVAELISRRDQGVTAGESRYQHQAVQTGHLIVAPGATSRIRARTGMGCFEFGYVRVVHLYATIRGIGVSM